MIDQDLYLYQFVRRIKHPSQKFGEIRSHAKSDILSCLEKCIRLPKALIDQKYTTLYLMGIIVHLLKLIGVDTFEDNAQQVFLPYVTSQKSFRIEVIWHGYKSGSLNFAVPERRRIATRNTVAANTIKYIKIIRVSQDWCTVDFLSHKVKIGPLSAIEPCTPKKGRSTYNNPRAQSCPDDYKYWRPFSIF